jgi:hypothetical protein
MPRPPHRILARLAPLPLCLVLGAGSSGCSSLSNSCSVSFSGFISEAGSVAPGCGTLTKDADAGTGGGYVLSLSASSQHVANLDAEIDLGATPAVGTFSSDTIANWSAFGLAGSGCGYNAGNQAVPTGSFTLTLNEVSNGASFAAHGTLDLTLYVHAPPATDCGPDETEDAHFTF